VNVFAALATCGEVTETRLAASSTATDIATREGHERRKDFRPARRAIETHILIRQEKSAGNSPCPDAVIRPYRTFGLSYKIRNIEHGGLATVTRHDG
jgi:hypothetical protein